jgi:hypothetical protein
VTKLDLVGLTEIAMRAGVRKPVVSMWRSRHESFPEPSAMLATGAVWFWPDVEKWLTDTGRETNAGWTVEQVNAGDKRASFGKG